MRDWKTAMLVGALLPAWGCQQPPDDHLADYSVAPDLSARAGDRFPGAGGVSLEHMLTLGLPEVSEDQTFGIIADAGLGADGSIFVVDGQHHRVMVFDSLGFHRLDIGSRGPGPGEFMAPHAIAVLDSTIAVFDAQLRTVSVFETGGGFVRSFRPPEGVITSLGRGPNRDLLLTAALGPARVHHLDEDGNRLGSYVRPPAIDAYVAVGYLPDPGRVCGLSPDALLYANPWIYELVTVGIANGERGPVRHWTGQAIRPIAADGEPGVAGVRQGGAVLGLACDGDTRVLASVDRSAGTLTYDFFRGELAPVARLHFARDEDHLFPGAIADLRNGRFLTYRNRPFPQVFVYRIQGADAP